MTLKLQSTLDIREVEECMALFAAENGPYIDIELHLSVRLKGFAVIPAFFQLMISWKRQSKARRLIIADLPKKESLEVDYTTENYLLFLSSIIAWRLEITDIHGKDIKKLLRPFNRAFIDGYWKNNLKGIAAQRSLLIPCCDHLPDRIGLLPILFSNHVLRDEDDFDLVSNLLIGLSKTGKTPLTNYLTKIQKDFNKILYEAFDNTQNWTTQSYLGETFNTSIRGFFGKFHTGHISGEMREFENLRVVKNYFSELRERVPLDLHSSFLEVSVFDSGSGLVQVFTGRSITEFSLSEEYDVLIQCLKKHSTSHKSIGTAYGRGAGLHRVMTMLGKMKGLLLVRTGRMFVYRNFLSIPFHNASKDTLNYSLLDIDNNSTIPQPRPHVEGTVMSMIIPHVTS